ncbi:MAG: B12-binding domain-containing radical SAM protein [Deltaproteobacteria bacterium]|nr:B12-binding domain-containing radical SAM protein [Deltaproteobacteria bacterium]MBW2137633.1 B12-binding domain-containing radical SAM protein [Deltaproteobacteria bacterium]
MHYEGTCIRPPSEAHSILLQVTVGCSHNKCTFCGTYKDKRFRIKDEDTILGDIKFASRYMKRQDRVFLMDGDALIIPQKRLLWILDRINEHLPWVKRIGAYANAKSIKMKTLDELVELKAKGLGILYLGVESGDEMTLRNIRKGTTPQNLVDMGKKVKGAGIKLSVTVLLGIAGEERSLEHARATGRLLSEMDPDFVGALTVMLIPGTPLYEDCVSGKFVLPDERGLLLELREMIEHTHLTRGLFFSNHASNYLPVKARLPRGKKDALQLIDSALEGKTGLRPEWTRAL